MFNQPTMIATYGLLYISWWVGLLAVAFRYLFQPLPSKVCVVIWDLSKTSD